jgi:hypothetical protein
MSQAGTHPNGVNSAPNEEHWTIRRWVSSVNGEVQLTWHMHKANVGGGNGVGGKLFVDGELVDEAAIGGTDAVGVTRSVVVSIEAGVPVDLALTPVGPDGQSADGSDGSENWLAVTLISEGPAAAGFRRGDVDGNGALEITDAINDLAYQFLGTFEAICLDAHDFDDNGAVEVTDSIGNLSLQFLGTGPAPAPGSETCGPDPTDDQLSCESYPEAACN